MKIASFHAAFPAGALLLGAAVLFAVNVGEREAGREGPVGEPVAERCSAKSVMLERGVSRKAWKLERELRTMSARQIRDALPVALSKDLTRPGDAHDRVRFLFERFGALEGEAALDELVSRYGAGNYTLLAMAHAIVGWMEADREGALAACRELTSPGKAVNGKPGVFDLLGAVSWKGTAILSPFG